ncbi:MAG: monodechloroaminopyrrolnitrin synthase PrnB family protein [Pseudomonadota bacterium]
MSNAAERFDRWIRSSFVELNTALEELYFAQDDRAQIDGVGDAIKAALSQEGQDLIKPLVREGNTDRRFDSAFDVLGNLGLFLGALRRHELTNPDRENASPFKECSALGMHIAASIGVTPRFATAHLTTHNRAIDGVQKSFTSLEDERLFNSYNLFSILNYKRAGEALMHIPAMGVSASATALMLEDAKAALEKVTFYNKTLFDKMDVDRFFFCVRPYFKPYRVGKDIYRGANAGDFAEINQIDLLLGLCRGNDPHYAQLLEEKILFMMPDDQKGLRQCLGMKPLLDEFVDATEKSADKEWFQTNCRLFLEVCDAHGRTAAQHHNMLVRKYIEKPADSADEKHLKQITASGPPLPALIDSLAHLRDLRMAAPRNDIETAHNKLAVLRKLIA